MTAPDLEAFWAHLPNPALAFDATLRIVALNASAESFLGASERQLAGQTIARYTGEDARIAELLRQTARQGVKMADYDVDLYWPETPLRLVDLHAAPEPATGGVLLLIHPRAIAESMDRSLSHRSAARSVAGLAAMLAHEVKNPLAGISGAAQLLQGSPGASQSDQELAVLIQEEVQRIGELMNRVEQFGEIGPVRPRAVNIHDVIDRAVKAARAGFARHIRFVEDYDPSLPPTWGDTDQLMQVMQNLLKNAAEAAPQVGGVITVKTAYRAGMKVLTPSGRRESLPLQVSVLDNGGGVPETLQRHIFEPFVTSKSSGSGLGLALVSKIVADHGGVISCESEPGWTRFRMLLPVVTEALAEDDAAEDAA